MQLFKRNSVIHKNTVLRAIFLKGWWGIYVLVLSLISYLNILPDVYRAFLALPVIIFVPIAVGKAVIFSLGRWMRKFVTNNDLFCRFFFLWLTGSVALFFFTLFFASFPVWDFRLYIFVFLFLVFVINLIESLRSNNTPLVNGYTWSTILGNKRILLPLLVVGFISALQIKLIQPSPLVQNPAYSVFLFSLGIIDGNTFYVRLGNPHLQALLASIPTVVTQVHPLLIFHSLPYLLLLLSPIPIYLLTYALTENIPASLFASVLATSLNINSLNNWTGGPILFFMFPVALYFVKKINFGTNKIFFKTIFMFVPILVIHLFFIAQNSIYLRNLAVILTLFVFLLETIILLKLGYTDSLRIYLLLSPLILFTLLIHEFDALFWLLLILISIIAFPQIVKLKYKRELCYCFIILSYFFVAIQLLGIVNFHDNFMFSSMLFGDRFKGSVLDRDAFSKFSWLQNSFDINLVYLAIMGSLIYPLLSKKKTIIPAFLLASTFLLLFLPEGHLWRIRPYISIFVAINLSVLLLDVPISIMNRIFIRLKRDQPKLVIPRFSNRGVRLFNVVALLILLLGLTFLVPIAAAPRLNFLNNQSAANNEGFFSQLLSYEVVLASWIYDNTPQNWIRTFWWNGITLGGTTGQVSLSHQTLIISDPYTMFMLEGLTGRSQAVDKRLWIEEENYSPESINLMETIKNEIFVEGAETAYEKINEMGKNFSKIILVITERTSAWLSRNQTFIEYPPSRLDKQLLERFNDTSYYRLLFSIPEKAYVFEIIVENKLEKNQIASEIIVDDEQTTFWTAVEDKICISNDITDKRMGESSLVVNISEGERYFSKFIEKKFETPQDYTSADFFSFHFKGTNSGKQILFGFDFKDGFVRYSFVDNFFGWRRIYFDKSAYVNSGGTIDWRKTRRILFGTTRKLDSDIVWKIDYVRFGEHIYA